MMPRWSTLAPLLRTIGKALGVILFAGICLLVAQIHDSTTWIFRALPGILLVTSLIVWNRNRVRAATLLFCAAFMSFFPLFFDSSVLHVTLNAYYALLGVWLAILLITLGIVIRAVSADDRQRAAQKMPRAE